MLYEDTTFKNEDFTAGMAANSEYELCTFVGCNFTEANISGVKFIECRFENCNLSLACTDKTAFRDVRFTDCKMLGFRFDTCNDFGFSVYFESCQLNHSSFYNRKLKKTTFKNCQLHEVDFVGTDLSGSVFDRCDLLRAQFDNTNLEKADLFSSFNYQINPATNRVKKAIFSHAAVIGLLYGFDIVIK